MRTSRPPLTPNAWLRSDLTRWALADLPPGATLLEIGPGQGAMGVRLAERFRYLGIEADERSGRVARSRIASAGGRIEIGDASAVELERRFDAVCAFEVLEHLEADEEALRGWLDRLTPGGRIVLSVPAGPDRMGPWDELVGHVRRYSRAGLRTVMAAAGLHDVVVRAYGFPAGYLLEAARNRLAGRAQAPSSIEARTAQSGRLYQSARHGWATWVATLPFRAVQRPFAGTELGTGLVARGFRSPRD